MSVIFTAELGRARAGFSQPGYLTRSFSLGGDRFFQFTFDANTNVDVNVTIAGEPWDKTLVTMPTRSWVASVYNAFKRWQYKKYFTSEVDADGNTVYKTKLYADDMLHAVLPATGYPIDMNVSLELDIWQEKEADSQTKFKLTLPESICCFYSYSVDATRAKQIENFCDIMGCNSTETLGECAQRYKAHYTPAQQTSLDYAESLYSESCVDVGRRGTVIDRLCQNTNCDARLSDCMDRPPNAAYFLRARAKQDFTQFSEFDCSRQGLSRVAQAAGLGSLHGMYDGLRGTVAGTPLAPAVEPVKTAPYEVAVEFLSSYVAVLTNAASEEALQSLVLYGLDARMSKKGPVFDVLLDVRMMADKEGKPTRPIIVTNNLASIPRFKRIIQWLPNVVLLQIIYWLCISLKVTKGDDVTIEIEPQTVFGITLSHLTSYRILNMIWNAIRGPSKTDDTRKWSGRPLGRAFHEMYATGSNLASVVGIAIHECLQWGQYVFYDNRRGITPAEFVKLSLKGKATYPCKYTSDKLRAVRGVKLPPSAKPEEQPKSWWRRAPDAPPTSPISQTSETSEPSEPSSDTRKTEPRGLLSIVRNWTKTPAPETPTTVTPPGKVEVALSGVRSLFAPTPASEPTAEAPMPLGIIQG